MEEHRSIRNYEGVYEVSNKGNVNRILKSGKRKPMKIQQNTHSQSVVGLTKKNKKTCHTLIRLVFNAFAPQHILQNGKKYDLVLNSKNKKDCSIDNITYYENKNYVVSYTDMTECERFAHDTKYITYIRHFNCYEYFRFKRIINYETYEEMWNVDTIGEQLDILKYKFKVWKEFIDSVSKTA